LIGWRNFLVGELLTNTIEKNHGRRNKKTAAKTAKKTGPGKHNPTIDRKHGNKPAGKGTKSQEDKAQKAGLSTGAKKLKRKC
jgi:hypothetical protein